MTAAGELHPHPASEIFPLLTGAEFDALVADIEQHGLREPIVLLDGMILDGRNRYRACRQLGLEPPVIEWDGTGSSEAFVVSKNLRRRHLSESQRATIAGRIATLKKGDIMSQCIDKQPKSDGGLIKPPQLRKNQAADLMNVSRDMVTKAKKVLREGTPEQIKAIDAGTLTVSKAVKQIRAAQRDTAGATPAVAKTLDEIRAAKRKTKQRAATGKNPERFQNQRFNAEIWHNLRTALISLNRLPLPADVAGIARAMDRTGLVAARLDNAVTWLKEFQRVSTKHPADV